ncbi:MAG: Excinuclease subunit domain protein [Pelosinus sp.]|nr:Excinuclease subunit domain protein [Pelosinus sp.]
MDRKKELKLTYKQTPLPMGVYQIKNNINGKILIGSSMNLPGIFNRHRFQLNATVHSIKELQEDWHQHGSDAFTCDVLEIIKSEDILKEDWPKAILALEEKWLSNLQPYGEKGYNQLKTIRK